METEISSVIDSNSQCYHMLWKWYYIVKTEKGNAANYRKIAITIHQNFKCFLTTLLLSHSIAISSIWGQRNPKGSQFFEDKTIHYSAYSFESRGCKAAEIWNDNFKAFNLASIQSERLLFHIMIKYVS